MKEFITEFQYDSLTVLERVCCLSNWVTLKFICLGEDWQTARKDIKSKMHILDPMGFDVKLQKALNPDDIRLAQ